MKKQVTLELPQGKQVHIPVQPSVHIHFLFSTEETLFERAGNDLVLTTPDGGNIVLQGFFAITDPAQMPIFIFPDNVVVEAKDLVPLIDDNFELFNPQGTPLLGEGTPPVGPQENALQGNGHIVQALSFAPSTPPAVLRLTDVLEETDERAELFQPTTLGVQASMGQSGAEHLFAGNSVAHQSHAGQAAGTPCATTFATPPYSAGATYSLTTATPTAEEEALNVLVKQIGSIG